MKYLFKGKIVDEEEVSIKFADRGYQFGDGIYEFVRVYNGKPFVLTDHIDRLFNSAKLVDMNVGYSRQEIEKFFYDLIEANEVDGGHVYIQITRGDSLARNHNYPNYEDQKIVISGCVAKYERDTKRIETGDKAITYPDLRWLMCNAKTLNLMPNCLAIHEAHKKGCTKAILHKDGRVTEERAGNVIIVKDGVLYSTPDSNEILPGITKLVVKRICEANNIPLVERNFTVEEMLNADEVIITDSKTEVCPCIEIDGKQIADGKRGKMTALLDEKYKELIIKECGKVA